MQISYLNMVQPTKNFRYPQEQIFQVILSVASAYVTVVKTIFAQIIQH